jgi:myosin heavy subunit
MASKRVILTHEMLGEPPYADMLKNLSKGNDEKIMLLVDYIRAIGSVREEVFLFLIEKIEFLSSKGTVNCIIELLKNDAALQWYDFCYSMYEKNQDSGLKTYLSINEAVETYKAGIPFETMKEYANQCENPIEMATARNNFQAESKDNRQNIDMMSLVENIDGIARKINEDVQVYRSHAMNTKKMLDEQENLKKELQHQTEMLQKKEASKNLDEDLTVIALKNDLERKNQMLEKVTKQRDQYHDEYQKSKQDYDNLNAGFLEYRDEMHRKHEEYEKESEGRQENSQVIVRMMEQMLSENKKLSNEIAELKMQVLAPSDVLDRIEQHFEDIDKKLVGSTISCKPNKKNTVEEENEKDISNEAKPSQKSEDKEEIEYTSETQDTEETQDTTDQLTDPARFIKPGIVKLEKSTRTRPRSDNKILQILNRVKRKPEAEKEEFSNLPIGKQKELLIDKMLEEDVDKEIFKCVQGALDSGISYEFLYTMVINHASIEEFKSVLNLLEKGCG